MTASAIDIELWVWPIDGGEDEARRYDGILSAGEIARANRFLNPAHGHAFRIAHGRLRMLLADRIGVAPASLVFLTGKHGKPSLDGVNGLAFNLSHSGSLAALAIADGCDIGCDIEEVREVKEDVAERFFSAEEVAQLRALPADHQNDAFFRCWTRKEAVVKALGDGLSMPLDRFTVDILADHERDLVRCFEADSTRLWRLAPLLPAAGYHGAVAARTDGRALRIVRRT